MALSSARQLFDQILAGGTPFLRSMVDEKKSETEWLDFKGADRIGDAETKSIWSKALCGFANNQGGVIIFGIDARFNDATKVDAASEFKLAPDAAALRSRLAQLHPSATEPPLSGVDMRAFFNKGDSGPGFVACFVPESDVKPHRAEQVDNKPYIIRIGDSFKIPSPSILRALFFPKTSPKLTATVTPHWTPIETDNPPPDTEILLKVFLQNRGFVSAKDVFVVVTTNPMGLTIEAPYKVEKIDSVEAEFGSGLAYPRSIHPSSNVQLCTIRHRVHVGSRISSRGTAYYPVTNGVGVKLKIYAADMMPTIENILVGDRDIAWANGA